MSARTITDINDVRVDLTPTLPTPTDLPDWARDAALNAVMAHPAEDIVTAIEVTGSADPAVLLGVLAGPELGRVTG